VLAAGVALLSVGCAPRPLLERAIRARGGAIRSLVSEDDATVHWGFPGVWRWRTVYFAPDRYALTVHGATEAFHYLFDGATVRAFTGEQRVAQDTAPGAPLRTHARFAAVVNLDALRLPRYRVVPLAPGDLLPEAREGLAVMELDTGSEYRLGFDARGLLAWATGPLDLDPLGRGQVTARFTAFHRVGGLLLPFRTSYALGDVALVDQDARAVCPNLAEVTVASFASPDVLPDCDTED
jgi:hypothetical protein